jgi:hypothetical protein
LLAISARLQDRQQGLGVPGAYSGGRQWLCRRRQYLADLIFKGSSWGLFFILKSNIFQWLMIIP